MKFSQEHQKLSFFAPVPVVFCLLLVFHGLGGGKDAAQAAIVAIPAGVNKNLPSAKADSNAKAQDKMQLYAKASEDSARLREQQKQDPYAAVYPMVADSMKRNIPAGVVPQGLAKMHTSIDQRQLAANATAEKVLEKVAELRGQLHTSEPGRGRTPAVVPGMGQDRFSALSEGLEANRKIARDPEMERIDAMLDKLIRIQHPDLVVQDTGRSSAPGRVFVLGGPGTASSVGSDEKGLDAATANAQGDGASDEAAGFIEIGEEDRPDTAGHSRELALEAVIDGDQTVTSGTTIALRLTKTSLLDGIAVPPGQLLYGQASINGERLMVHVSSLRLGDLVLPVSIQVYDLDGLPGIRVPGAMTREVSKESASEAMSGLGLASMDPSLTGQAANAGLQLAKSLTSKKIRAVRVTLPAGYKVLLKNIK